MGNWKLNVNKEEKELFFYLAGEVSEVDAAVAFIEFKKAILQIETGYLIICDITEFKSATFESRLLLEKALKLIDSKEPREVIRLVDNISEDTLFDEAHINLEVRYQVKKKLKNT